jgi:predicted FMN-binding regulatory protein PaiB
MNGMDGRAVDVVPVADVEDLSNSMLIARAFPEGLWHLCLVEFLERASFYGIRAILILYMVAPIAQGGLALPDSSAAGLQDDGRATALFSGPHGYISPSRFRDRTQAPTWNVTTLKMRLRIRIDDRPECADAVLARLVEHMERGRPHAWAIADMATRYERLRRGIVGFYGEVLTGDAKFKLGQNERIDVLVDQMAGLEENGRADLASWVREHNARRTDMRPIASETNSSAPE